MRTKMVQIKKGMSTLDTWKDKNADLEYNQQGQEGITFNISVEIQDNNTQLQRNKQYRIQ